MRNRDIEKIGILKSVWGRAPDGQWAVRDLKGLYLNPKTGHAEDYFAFESSFQVMNESPRSFADLLGSMGPTDFFMKQSIVPVVACSKDDFIRVIGTGFIVSCTGLLITATHVILDPQESGYATAKRSGRNHSIHDVALGVLLPSSPAFEPNGFRFLPFEIGSYWGEWQESPLVHEKDSFKGLTDVAVCRLPPLKDGGAYQPLHLSLFPFARDEEAYAIGYAEMKDIPIERHDVTVSVPEFDWEMYVSIGRVLNVFPHNAIEKNAPTPGPCFDFGARIPGKMSGAPIFGAQGTVVRGVVSRSFSDEKHAYGCMIGPAMTLPLVEGKSLRDIMLAGEDGMAVVSGRGL